MDADTFDYETQRLRNIERNNSFLGNLGVPRLNPSQSKSDAPTEPDTASSVGDLPIFEDYTEDSERLDEILASCCDKFPHRGLETDRIVKYIDQDDIALPPLIVYGNSGTGKTSICQEILRQCHVLHASVLCTCYGDSLEVVQALWEAMLNAVESRFISSQKRKSDKMNKVPGRNRKISFTTVYDNIRGLMDSFSVKRFVILFDHVDCLQNMDAPITEKLLRMSELIHPNLKIIAIRRNLIGADCMNKLTLQFKPYSDADIVHIINKKIKATAADLKRDSRLEYESEQRLGDSGKKTKQSLSTRGEYPIGDEQLLQFMEVLRDVLPRLRMTTGHLNEMLNVTLKVWRLSGKGSGSDVLEAGANTVTSNSRIAEHVLKLPFLRYHGNEESTERENSRLDSEAGQDIDPESLRGVRWTGDISYKGRYLLIAAYLASKVSKESDKFTFGDEQKGRRKRTRGGHDSQLTEATAPSAGESALLYAPQTFNLERLLAIFKHIYESNHRMYDAELKTTHTATCSANPGSNVSTNSDTLIAAGDDNFFAMINNLERLNFLAPATSWRDDQPMYYCAVDKETVRVIARSVHFPVQNYVSSW